MTEELAEPEKVDLETPDLAAAKRAAFEQQFPGVLADGVIDAERLKELLDVEVIGAADDRERYGLMWAGKKEAVRSLQTPSRGTLIPHLDASVGWDSARNVFIEGDNLEVLKLLQKAYNDKVKLIYIDPPYNTGNEFVYQDDFNDGVRAYLARTGQLGADGSRTAASADRSGRRHSRWLSMMYPRLVLARNLLKQDGFLFVSISDTEYANIKTILDEIFGEDCFVETFVWHSIFRPSNLSRRVRRNAEYILCYRRTMDDSFELVERLEDAKGEASLTKNSNAIRPLTFSSGVLHVKIPDGVYAGGNYGDVTLDSALVVSEGRNAAPVTISGHFAWSQSYLDDEIRKGAYLAIKTRSMIPYVRKDYQKTALRPTKILPRDLVGDVLEANAEVNRLLPEGAFDYPKPTSLILHLMKMVGVEKDECVLDFFAGSGTTGHAVLRLNLEDGGTRRFIAVNFPEKVPKDSAAADAGFRFVSEIGRSRLKAALNELHADSGLRSLRLDLSCFRASDIAPDELFDLQESTLQARDYPMEYIAQEVLLKEGVRLDATWEHHQVADAKVIMADGVAVVLSLELSKEIVDAALGLEPKVVVFLEDGFAGADAVKANAFTNAKHANIVMKTV